MKYINDYDEDGNNIVPCPICLNVHCPANDFDQQGNNRNPDGKCPKEDMFALEAEIRLLLDEYKATDDNSRIANVLEAVEKLLTQYHQDLMREVVEKLEGLRVTSDPQLDFINPHIKTWGKGYNCGLTEAKDIIKSLSK